jgi:hypothetical protein
LRRWPDYRLTSIRVDFTTQAINLRIATLCELVRFLHRDPPALTKLTVRHRRQTCTGALSYMSCPVPWPGRLRLISDTMALP